MRPSPLLLIATAGLAVVAPAAAQDVSEPARLAGVDAIAVRTSAVWDELITTSAGGATEAQFEEALLMGLREAISGAELGPRLDDDASSFVLCHVDTFYESTLIIYSVRVSYHEQGPGGRPAITWLRSWVGSYTAQQLHVIWTLADQCANAFLRDWRTVNSG